MYTPLLFGWARRSGESDHDAADLVQEVFVTLMQTMPRFEYDEKGNFRRWLRTLLVNKLRDRIRRRRRDDKAYEQVAVVDELPDQAERFFEAEYQRELSRRALSLMQRDFEPATWKACWETVVEGRPADEVARDLGLSRNAVYVARCRVLRKLREDLRGLVE